MDGSWLLLKWSSCWVRTYAHDFSLTARALKMAARRRSTFISIFSEELIDISHHYALQGSSNTSHTTFVPQVIEKTEKWRKQQQQ